MREELIEYVKNNIDSLDIEYTYSQMCIQQVPLHHANNNLFNQISNLVDDFVSDNELSEEWFEETFIDIEDLFECLFD